jgi:hypothetical protein
VPIEQNVFLVVDLVVDDFDRQGRSWREADVKHTDLETVIQDMLEGQYPVQRPRPCDPQVASIPPKRYFVGSLFGLALIVARSLAIRPRSSVQVQAQAWKGIKVLLHANSISLSAQRYQPV